MRTVEGRTRARVASLAPGLALSGLGVAVAVTSHELLLTTVSPLVIAAVLGAVVANTRGPAAAMQRGLAFAARRLLRAGVVLLGFRIALSDVATIGAANLAVVVVVVIATLVGTRLLGNALGVSRSLSTVIGVGFAICGASAIAAVSGLVDADESETTFAVALVTVCGSIAVVVTPFVAAHSGLSDGALGAWLGASVHDVGQVIAAASAAGRGPDVMRAAVIVKMTRVALLAVVVAVLSLRSQRREPSGAASRETKRPVVPLFVAGFVVAAAVRSLGVLPDAIYGPTQQVETWLLAAGMFGLGTKAVVRHLQSVGVRAALVGAGAWVLVGAMSWGGIALANR